METQKSLLTAIDEALYELAMRYHEICDFSILNKGYRVLVRAPQDRLDKVLTLYRRTLREFYIENEIIRADEYFVELSSSVEKMWQYVPK